MCVKQFWESIADGLNGTTVDKVTKHPTNKVHLETRKFLLR